MEKYNMRAEGFKGDAIQKAQILFDVVTCVQVLSRELNKGESRARLVSKLLHQVDIETMPPAMQQRLLGHGWPIMQPIEQNTQVYL